MERVTAEWHLVNARKLFRLSALAPVMAAGFCRSFHGEIYFIDTTTSVAI